MNYIEASEQALDNPVATVQEEQHLHEWEHDGDCEFGIDSVWFEQSCHCGATGYAIYNFSHDEEKVV